MLILKNEGRSKKQAYKVIKYWMVCISKKIEIYIYIYYIQKYLKN